jgi:hypothetical protein
VVAAGGRVDLLEEPAPAADRPAPRDESPVTEEEPQA